MLTEKQIWAVMDEVPATHTYALDVARAVEAKVLELLRAQLPGKTHEHTLRAMADNYQAGNLWDAIDAQSCLDAAAEIAALRGLVAKADGAKEAGRG